MTDTDTNADFAMQYAEERKMRINLENRLHAVMYEVIPYMAITQDIIDAVIEKDADKLSETLVQYTNWRPDLEVNMYLNMIDPKGKLHALSEDTISKATGQVQDIPHKEMQVLRAAYEEAAEIIYEQWEELAAKHEKLCTRRQAATAAKKHLAKMVLENTINNMKKDGVTLSSN